MKFILEYPEVTGTDRTMLEAGHVGEMAACAESAGFHGFALTEHPSPGANWLRQGGHQTLDPFIGLAFAAAATRTLRIVTYLTVLPYRNPLLFAKGAATLDRLSNGRLILGVGTGYHKTEFYALGVDFGERNALFEESLDVLSLAWSGQPFSYRGRHFDARDVLQLPPPAQEHIPIWIGGNSTLSRSRAAERGNGWMPLLSRPEVAQTSRTPYIGSTEELARLIEEVKGLAGGRASSLDFVGVYHDPSIQRGDAVNDVGRHVAAFQAYAEAGVTWMIVRADTQTPAEQTAFIEQFGRACIQ